MNVNTGADKEMVSTFGRFRILQELGRGGMGVVFRAHDPGMGRDVAIKVLRLDPALGESEQADIARRFAYEAQAAGGLNHAHIVAHYERGEINGHHYIVMELVDGPSLHQVMSQEKRPEPGWYLTILRQAAAALDYAHSRGLVHRDIKPANLLLQHSEIVKVADFGIAKCTLAEGMTATSVMIGSPHYMAPEQIEGQPVSGRTDQWALAVTAYELLSGRKPFESDSVASLFRQILSAPPPDPAERGAGIPTAARRVFTKALSKRADERFESCTAFVDALEGCFASAHTEPLVRPGRGRYTLTVVGVLALAAISLVGRIHLHSGREAAWSSGTAFHTGEVKANRRDGLSYVWIGPGSFRMGCSAEDSDCEPDEQPHHVTLTQGYWIGKTEVTAGAFKRFSMATGARMPVAHGSNRNWSDETRPISNVGWDDAGAYCRWAEARLPTEAEWEMAARSGTTLARYGPLDEVAWHKDNSGGSPHAVGGKRPNPSGLVDVLGNVWEWTADRYASNRWSAAAAVNPAGPESGHFRVLRGGSWLRSVAEVRVSDRYPVLPDSPDHGTGFRCVADEMP